MDWENLIGVTKVNKCTWVLVGLVDINMQDAQSRLKQNENCDSKCIPEAGVLPV